MGHQTHLAVHQTLRKHADRRNSFPVVSLHIYGGNGYFFRAVYARKIKANIGIFGGIIVDVEINEMIIRKVFTFSRIDDLRTRELSFRLDFGDGIGLRRRPHPSDIGRGKDIDIRQNGLFRHGHSVGERDHLFPFRHTDFGFFGTSIIGRSAHVDRRACGAQRDAESQRVQ